METQLSPGDDQSTLFASNHLIDKALVEHFRSLEKELARLGVDTKSRYSLTPPLGGAKLLLFNV